MRLFLTTSHCIFYVFFMCHYVVMVFEKNHTVNKWDFFYYQDFSRYVIIDERTREGMCDFYGFNRERCYYQLNRLLLSEFKVRYKRVCEYEREDNLSNFPLISDQYYGSLLYLSDDVMCTYKSQ